MADSAGSQVSEGVAPITTELRETIRSLAIDDSVLTIGGDDFHRLCDTIDAVHAGLERENAELRERLAVLDNRSESMHIGSATVTITDELRKWAEGDALRAGMSLRTARDQALAIADRIDAEHERELAEQQDSLTVGMQPMTEENMAEGGWVRGPLDADGKMWRRGDMSDSNWGVIEGIAYEDGRWFVSGHDTSAPWIPADSIRHYHEPTVEDVLQKLLEQAVGYSDAHTTVALNAIAKYAKRLRLSGDAE